MHFVMYASSNHAKVLHKVTPIVQLQQSAVLSDGVVAKVLHKVTPFVLLQQTAVLSDGEGCGGSASIHPHQYCAKVTIRIFILLFRS